MLQYLRRLIAQRDEDGASAVEYGLLVAAIAAVIVIIVFALGGIIKDAFKSTCDAVNNGSFSHAATSC
jgi:pilus assembly protein Flp/PilA